MTFERHPHLQCCRIALYQSQILLFLLPIIINPNTLHRVHSSDVNRSTILTRLTQNMLSLVGVQNRDIRDFNKSAF